MASGWRSCENLTFSRITSSVSFARGFAFFRLRSHEDPLLGRPGLWSCDWHVWWEPMQRTMMLRSMRWWMAGHHLHLVLPHLVLSLQVWVVDMQPTCLPQCQAQKLCPSLRLQRLDHARLHREGKPIRYGRYRMSWRLHFLWLLHLRQIDTVRCLRFHSKHARRPCEAVDHGLGRGYSLEDWYQWYLSEELTSDVMDNLTFAWFPDNDIIRLVWDLTDFPFSPENAIVKVATPEMALNPLFDPNAVPSDQPPCSSSDQSDPLVCPAEHELPTESCGAQRHCLWLPFNDTKWSLELPGEW